MTRITSSSPRSRYIVLKWPSGATTIASSGGRSRRGWRSSQLPSRSGSSWPKSHMSISHRAAVHAVQRDDERVAARRDRSPAGRRAANSESLPSSGRAVGAAHRALAPGAARRKGPARLERTRRARRARARRRAGRRRRRRRAPRSRRGGRAGARRSRASRAPSARSGRRWRARLGARGGVAHGPARVEREVERRGPRPRRGASSRSSSTSSPATRGRRTADLAHGPVVDGDVAGVDVEERRRRRRRAGADEPRVHVERHAARRPAGKRTVSDGLVAGRRPCPGRRTSPTCAPRACARRRRSCRAATHHDPRGGWSCVVEHARAEAHAPGRSGGARGRRGGRRPRGRAATRSSSSRSGRGSRRVTTRLPSTAPRRASPAPSRR